MSLGYHRAHIDVVEGPWHCRWAIVVVAVAERVVGSGLNVVSGGSRIKGWKRTNHDFHRGSLSGHTEWASHCLGLKVLGIVVGP